MTISLLRRIWQQIIADAPATPTKQRLTGFEPLEPRMVLSGFMAYMTPDYFSPPPGNFSHFDHGSEIARPSAEFGGLSDYNGPGRGLGNALQDYRSVQAEPLAAPYDHPASGERLLG